MIFLTQEGICIRKCESTQILGIENANLYNFLAHILRILGGSLDVKILSRGSMKHFPAMIVYVAIEEIYRTFQHL